MGRKKRIKQPIGVSIDVGLLEEIRNAAYWTRHSVARVFAMSIERELKRLERGTPFPPKPDDEPLVKQPGKPYGPRGEETPRVMYVFIADPELIARLRNAAYALKTNLSEIVTEGAVRTLAELRLEHNKGKPFSQREDR